MAGRCILIGCGNAKRNKMAAAKDLYLGPLFRARRAKASTSGLPWFILSAKHGFVHPMTPLAPYDQIIRKDSPCDALERSFEVIGGEIDEAIILAGGDYVAWIERFGRFRRIFNPLDGIQGIGTRCNRIQQLNLKALR